MVALQDTTLSDLWVGKADGSEAKQVTSGESLGFGLEWLSGKVLAGNQRGRWSLMNPDGSNPVRVNSESEPRMQLTICGENKYMVYSTWYDGAFELWRSDVDGANPVKLSPTAILGGAICSPDGRSVVYGAGTAIWRTSINGGAPAKTDLPFAQLAYSHNGKLMYYLSQKVEGGNMQAKLVLSPADTPATVLRAFDVPYGMQSPAFTPDDSALAYMLTRQGATNIWQQPLSGGDPVQLTKFTSGEMFSFAWSQEGKQLAMSRGRRKSDVVMMSNFR
jgi:Tol biopolymer transport system component